MGTLQGRRARVTGSVQGIGLAIAKALAREGSTVVLHGLPDPQVHAAACAVLAEFSPATVLNLGHDLEDPAQVQRLMREVLDAGPLHILVNNAGVQYTAALQALPRARWDAILAINLSAAFDTMRLALPGTVACGYGRIVHVASVHGLVASVNKAPYVAAKIGLDGLTRVATQERARAGHRASGGVTANRICPGWTETAIIEPQIQARALPFGGDRDAGIADLLREKQPSGRMWTPDEIAQTVVRLPLAHLPGLAPCTATAVQRSAGRPLRTQRGGGPAHQSARDPAVAPCSGAQADGWRRHGGLVGPPSGQDAQRRACRPRAGLDPAHDGRRRRHLEIAFCGAFQPNTGCSARRPSDRKAHGRGPPVAAPRAHGEAACCRRRRRQPPPHPGEHNLNMSANALSVPHPRRLAAWRITRQAPATALILLAAWWVGGCTTVQPPAGPGQSSLPVLSGWFEGEAVFYITTDVSHADVAEAKGANFAPRLGLALPEGRAAPGRSSVDKVYAVTNFKQASVFASAPYPVGSTSRDTAYSPLWQMVKVTWTAGSVPQILKSEEDVLAAVERGAAVLEVTRVVLNCPIVHRGPKGALPGVSITRAPG